MCEDKVVVVTGGGRGIGRATALEFARQGARVVVNDLGSTAAGAGADRGPADDVVAEIREAGGQAVANGDDIGDFDSAGDLIQSAIDAFGNLDVLVNNAGILRDRMLVNMTPDEWDSVIRVHLRGTFATSHHAANHWRARSKLGPVSAAIINTTSASGLYGNVGQSNYGAAKAGIASFSVIIAEELRRYGVTVNAVAPAAATRMTDAVISEAMQARRKKFDLLAPENIAPLIVWLGGTEARDVTGRVFNVMGGHLSIANGWLIGPEANRQGRWAVSELGPVVRDLVARANPKPGQDGRIPAPTA